MDAIVASGLTKRYGRNVGVEDLDFTVRKGEVFGFLGPNGSGKTTTIRLMLDLIRPTQGTLRILGLDSVHDSLEMRRRIGFQPAEPGTLRRTSARDHLRFLADLRRRAGIDIPEGRTEELAARLALDLDRPMASLSRGNRQKVGLVQAFQHDPDILVLDEPTGGLDPLMQQEFNCMVREASSRGRTVFLSSHVLSEVEALCDRVGIVRAGRMVAIEEVHALKAKALRKAFARFPQPVSPQAMADVPGVSEVQAEGDFLAFLVQGPTGPAVRALAELGVTDLSLEEATVESLFLGYYGGSS